MMPKDVLQQASRLGTHMRGITSARFSATSPYLRRAGDLDSRLRRHHSSPAVAASEVSSSQPTRILRGTIPKKDVLTHPEYSDPTADLVVESSDGMQFHVHSAVLKLASDTFAKALHDSQGGRLAEDRTTLRALLDWVYPRHLSPKLEPFTFVAKLAAAAEKYKVERVSSKIRSALISDPPLHSGTPLHHYALATNLLWEDEARHVSRFVPPPNPTNIEQRPILQSLDNGALLKLMLLHHTRRDVLLKALSISYDQNAAEDVRAQHLRWEFICEGHPDPCRSRGHSMAQWEAFKLHVLMELDRESPNDFLLKLDKLWETHQFKVALAETCSRCSKPFFDKDILALEFRRVVDRLPHHVD